MNRKKTLFWGCILLLISLILTNCEREENVLEVQRLKTIHRITLDEFQSQVSQKNYDQLSKYFQGNTHDQNTRNTSSNEFIVLTNSIVSSQNGVHTSYTFQVIKETTGSEFYNLIITINDLGEITKSDVYEYIPSVAYNSNPNEQFVGSVKTYPDHNIDIEELFYDRSSDMCVVDAVGYWTCSYGDNHEPGSCESDSFDYNIQLIYGACSPEPTIVEVTDGGGGGSNPGNGPFDPTDGGGTGNDNPDPIDNDDVNTTPINEPVDYPSEIISCINDNNIFGGSNFSLSQTQEDWINNTASNRELIDLWGFLNSNSCGQDAQEFALEAIDALENGGEVDYEDGIIIDESVPDCLKEIIRRFQENDVYIDLGDMPDFVKEELNLSGRIMDVFNNSDNYHLTFKVANLPPNSNGFHINATTEIVNNFSSTGNVFFNVIINESYIANATDLAIARTIIHESLHAYISFIYQTQIFSDLSESLAYILSQNGSDMNTSQHILMSQQFVEKIASSLQSWDNNGLNNNEYYNFLSWSGNMLNTVSFNNLDTSFKQNVINANVAEGNAGPNGANTSNSLGDKNCN